MHTTSRNAQIVAWLGRLGAAGAQHVRERFEMGRSLAYIRLAELVSDGLVEHRKVLHGWPGVYTATREGLRWQGLSRLPVFQPSPGGFEHAWQMASTAVALARELPDWQLFAEREIGLLQAKRERLVAWAKVGSIGPHPAYHRPDFALISPAQRIVVVEVERTPKDPRRLVRICRGWTRARHVEHVYYLSTPSAARAVRRAAERVRGTDVITVLDLEDVPRLAELELARLAGAEAEDAARNQHRCASTEVDDVLAV